MSTKQDHKRWRKQFNENCLERDGHKCVFCNIKDDLDVHHITARAEMPNGGYSTTNGITVCKEHHFMCEKYHMGEEVPDGFHPDELYTMIGTYYEQAVIDCENLK